MATLLQRLVSLVAKARVRTVTQGPVETVQLETPGGLNRSVERFEYYGFASATLPGADVVRFYALAAPETPVALGSHDRRYRPTNLSPGDSCLYNQHGDRVQLKANRTLAATINGATIDASATSIKLAIGATSIELTPAGITMLGPSGIPVTVV